MADSEDPDTPNFDLERERLALEQKRLALDERHKQEDVRLTAERLRLDVERLKLDQRFVNRHLAAILLFGGTILTICISLAQIRVNENNNAAALRLQIQRNASDATLAQRNADASYRKEMMTFVTANQEKLSSQDDVIRNRYKAILKATFPELADQWLQVLNFETPRANVAGSPPSESQVPTANSRAPVNADWMLHLKWSIADRGPVDCLDQYAGFPECIFGGGRSCVMRKAVLAAKTGDYGSALRLSTITQCHNGAARSAIESAGQQAVGDFLKAQNIP